MMPVALDLFAIYLQRDIQTSLVASTSIFEILYQGLIAYRGYIANSVRTNLAKAVTVQQHILKNRENICFPLALILPIRLTSTLIGDEQTVAGELII